MGIHAAGLAFNIKVKTRYRKLWFIAVVYVVDFAIAWVLAC
jgi:hypothetical protein